MSLGLLEELCLRDPGCEPRVKHDTGVHKLRVQGQGYVSVLGSWDLPALPSLQVQVLQIYARREETPP